MTTIDAAAVQRTVSLTGTSLTGLSATAWQWDLGIAPGLRTDKPYWTQQAIFAVSDDPSQPYFHQEFFYSWRLGLQSKVTNIDGHNVVFNMPDRFLINSYSSVRADFAIGVNFVSNGTGSVTITSNNALTVAGAIDNATGTTAITAPRIYQGTAGLVGGKNITLSTSDGIGTDTSALAVSLAGGNLTASSTFGSINIAATGGLKLNTVTAAGNVKLSATNDIVSSGAMNLNATPTITGNNITLTTTGGAIGAITALVGGNPAPTNIQPLVLQAGGVVNASGSTA